MTTTNEIKTRLKKAEEQTPGRELPVQFLSDGELEAIVSPKLKQLAQTDARIKSIVDQCRQACPEDWVGLSLERMDKAGIPFEILNDFEGVLIIDDIPRRHHETV